MKIDMQQHWKPIENEIVDTVASTVVGHYSEGQMEQTQSEVKRLTEIVGHLLNVLATKGLVSVEETRTIIRGY